VRGIEAFSPNAGLFRSNANPGVTTSRSKARRRRILIGPG